MCENPTDWLLDSNFCSFINKTAKTTLIMQFLSATPGVLTRPHPRCHSRRFLILKKSPLDRLIHCNIGVWKHSSRKDWSSVSIDNFGTTKVIITAHKGRELFQILLEGLHLYRISNYSSFHHLLPSSYIFPVSILWSLYCKVEQTGASSQAPGFNLGQVSPPVSWPVQKVIGLAPPPWVRISK